MHIDRITLSPTVVPPSWEGAWIVKEIEADLSFSRKWGALMAYWIFKFDPKIYSLDDRSADPTSTITANVPQHHDRIAINDIAFLWETGSKRGIKAVMRVDQRPEETPEVERELEYYLDARDAEAQRIIRQTWRVIGTLILTKIDLRMNYLRTVPGLEKLSAFEPWRQTVFPVRDEEGAILLRLVEGDANT